MGLKDDLTARFAPILKDVEKLDEGWPDLSQQDVHDVLGRFFGVAYSAIGELINAVMDLAGEIDGIKHESS
jgi:hypothetical protein